MAITVDEETTLDKKLGVTSSSSMISFRPPRHIAEDLMRYAHGIKNVNDLHVTLLYLGEIPYENHRHIVRARWAHWNSNSAPFDVRISGVTVFNNGDEHIMVALVELDREWEIRESLLHSFPGMNASSFSGFKPHITLRYRKGRRFWLIPRIPQLKWTQYQTDFCIGKARFSKYLLGKLRKNA